LGKRGAGYFEAGLGRFKKDINHHEISRKNPNVALFTVRFFMSYIFHACFVAASNIVYRRFHKWPRRIFT